MNNNEKIKMPTQEANIRNKNFEEVELGYSKEQAISEASRCLHCKIPKCIEGCPVRINIPEFIKNIKEDNIEEAYKIITESSSLPAVCGRVCPQEKQCEAKCVKGIRGDSIAIGSLERYVADQAIINNISNIVKKDSIGKKVAIIGSGPAGLSCAGELAKNGVDVTIFEVLHKAGGVLVYGIPEFRLPKSIVRKQIESLENLGVEIKLNVPVGNAITIEELRQEYDAVFIATGAGIPKFMGIKGEDASGVFSANEILTRINLMGAYKDESTTPIKNKGIAYVIGGGNVAMDAARSLKRLGIEVHLMYRRGEEELPARKMEVEHAKEEGIIFDFLNNPTQIMVDENNNVTGMEVVKMELTEPNEDGRRGVKEIENSNYKVECNIVVMALGTDQNNEAIKDSNIEITDRGLIKVEETKTNLDNVYAGGDATSGAATVILAMEAGKNAAKKILENLK